MPTDDERRGATKNKEHESTLAGASFDGVICDEVRDFERIVEKSAQAPTNEERRQIASDLRDLSVKLRDGGIDRPRIPEALAIITGSIEKHVISWETILDKLAGLIEHGTSSFYDAAWSMWYESLCHSDADNSPESLRDVLEDIVWAVLTIDLGPNGDVCQGVDEGIVQTESLFDAWERKIREIIEREG